MYGFSNNLIRIGSKKELNKIVSDEQILKHYYGDYELDTWMIAPREEERPSFKIDYYDGELRWRDFGYDVRPKDAVNFVMYLEELNGRKISYHDALNKILKEVPNDIKYEANPDYKPKKKADLRVQYRRKFKDFEKDYWISQKLSKRTLNFYETYPGEIWFEDRVWFYSRKKDPLFLYLFDKEEGFWKGYRPKAKQTRFIESGDKSIIQGMSQLKQLMSHKNDTLIITKSQKDVMTYYELGYMAVAPQSETIFITESQLEWFKKHFNNILVNYDPDPEGMKSMQSISEIYSLPFFHFGDEGVKDVTEFRISAGTRNVQAYLNSLNVIK